MIPLFLCGTALRIGEGLGMDPADINFLRREAQVRRQLLQSNTIAPLKTKKSRRDLPVGAVTIDALAAHL